MIANPSLPARRRPTMLAAALDDDDLRVAWIALGGLQHFGEEAEEDPLTMPKAKDLFERLERRDQLLRGGRTS